MYIYIYIHTLYIHTYNVCIYIYICSTQTIISYCSQYGRALQAALRHGKDTCHERLARVATSYHVVSHPITLRHITPQPLASDNFSLAHPTQHPTQHPEGNSPLEGEGKGETDCRREREKAHPAPALSTRGPKTISTRLATTRGCANA